MEKIFLNDAITPLNFLDKDISLLKSVSVECWCQIEYYLRSKVSLLGQEESKILTEKFQKH